MPCAAGELCHLKQRTPKAPDGHAYRGGCGGRLHGTCAEMEGQGGNELHCICFACAKAKQSTTSASKAAAGKRKGPGTVFGEAGSSKRTREDKSSVSVCTYTVVISCDTRYAQDLYIVRYQVCIRFVYRTIPGMHKICISYDTRYAQDLYIIRYQACTRFVHHAIPGMHKICVSYDTRYAQDLYIIRYQVCTRFVYHTIPGMHKICISYDTRYAQDLYIIRYQVCTRFVRSAIKCSSRKCVYNKYSTCTALVQYALLLFSASRSR